METTHEQTHSHKHGSSAKGFYIFIGLVSFGILVLQPLAMLSVMIISALISNS